SSVTGSTVPLVQDGRDTATAGTSAEPPNLGIEVDAASQLAVTFEASGGASSAANGILLFVYYSPNADTWSQAPDVSTGASSDSGTLTLSVPAGVVLGTVGVVYDNPDHGTVTFTGLSLNGEPVPFLPAASNGD